MPVTKTGRPRIKVTVTIDRNEKRPLRFPKTIRWYPSRGAKGQQVLVRTQTKVLPAGDYALAGFEDRCIIERKGSLRELAQNLLSDDWARANRAFGKLSLATANPYLMLECTPAELRKAEQWVQEPARVIDALAALIERFGFRLLLCGSVKTVQQKQTVGELMLRLMLAHAYHKEEDYTQCDMVIEKMSSIQGQPGTPTTEKDAPP